MKTMITKRFFTLFSLSLTLIFALLPIPAFSAAALDFELPDAEGNRISLSDYRGQPVVLHFWATWCPYCKKVQPGLEKLQQEFKDQGVVVLGVSFSEDKGADPQGVLRKRGHTFKTLVSGDAVARFYGVQGTPTTFFISKSGEIVGKTTLSDPESPVLRQLMQEALKAQ